MNEYIHKRITTLQQEQNVRILYACEAGSRAYGIAAPGSDYDVRLITIKPVRSYLSVSSVRETWSESLPPVELHSWDVFKALKLFTKSNPSLYEWFLSPIIYNKDDFFYNKMNAMIQRYYSLRRLAHHYHSLAKRNSKELARKEQGSRAYIKTYVQALRGALAVRWIVQNRTLPPLSLLHLSDGDETMSELVCLLQKAKQGERIALRFFSVDRLLPLINIEPTMIDSLPSGETIDARVLDEFVWALLGV
ncbi:nucleotidyltransferase domain-containing protein [Thermaerobacillus caldiproteolyticus]|uniref:nucleotidyltransferase domain-containing protein n=1 Tax=Thermaerobacillus caldiproteolyticus TaxID=247480 RepID=UPI00188A688B|nr:nucleotidyltransferase domain-containing protein [Anoxybacillus caldiproteolyticus]QPA32727.1 nucleotidyltransferase domain-containing protein [Anoxybacillus caldiproteolyticus]